MQPMNRQLPTPRLVLDAARVRRNIQRMSEYASAHRINLRPHTKTHKSKMVARMQLDVGACGLTVAKVGEAQAIAAFGDDLLVAYPVVDPLRCGELAKLAQTTKLQVGIDSTVGADALSQAAAAAAITIGVLVEMDVGFRRTGVATPDAALRLAQYIDRRPHLRLDGIMFYPGHLADPSIAPEPALRQIDEMLRETISLWKQHGLEAGTVSGGSTPTARLSHLMPSVTEIRPGTYVFHDMNCVRGGYATLEDCAARFVCTVVSDAVPGQVVIDAGTKTLTSDRCGPAPDSGHGLVVEYPQAQIVRLTEEHGQVDIRLCQRVPRVGEQVTVIPNHICPCVNLHDTVWWLDDGVERPIAVDARGKVF
jgi:D-serine deaminase-like pyridoxal phosphate-dependent protein